jgi:hypothetical protein
MLKCLEPPAHAGSSLGDFSTLKMEAICKSRFKKYLQGATSQKTAFFFIYFNGSVIFSEYIAWIDWIVIGEVVQGRCLGPI